MKNTLPSVSPEALEQVAGGGDGANMIFGSQWHGNEKRGCIADTAAFAGAGLVAGSAMASPGFGAIIGGVVGFGQSANCAHLLGADGGEDVFSKE